MKLILGYPVKSWFVNQEFGEKNDFYKKNGIDIIGHNGIDVRGDHVPIYASHDGEVTFAGDDGSAGLGVVIRTLTPFEYNGEEVYFKTIYWHLAKDTILVKPNQIVKRGEQIALADNTGLSTGPHLHFGLKPIKQGEQPWQWANIEQNNGYFGAIDPMPYLRHFFDSDIKQGDSGAQVTKLQTALSKLGFFNHGFTDYYGIFTREAVYNFQLKYVPMSWYEKYIRRGNSCGPKTRMALNKLISECLIDVI